MGFFSFLQQEIARFIQQGEKICIYTAEMTNQKVLRKFYIQCSGRNNIKAYKSNYYDGDYYMPIKENVEKIKSWLGENLFLIKDGFDAEKKDIFSIFEQLVYQKNVKIFIIDNLLTAVRQDQNLLYNQTNFLKRSQLFAKKHDATVHVVAHQRKLSEEHKSRYRPTIDGILGSSNIRNLIDVCVGMARVSTKIKETKPEIVHDAEIIILKERDSGVEGVGSNLLFEKNCLRFIENWNDIDYELGWEEL
jgi:hypothetical protein